MQTPALFRHSPQHPWRTALVLCALLSVGNMAWAQLSAGKVMSVSGNAKAIDTKGNERLLEKGAEVYSGDKVVTAEGALVQMRLNDGGYMSVRSSTEMVIDRFVYDDKDASKSNFLVSLVRGGFRSITGLIGRTNPGAYQIRTSTATVGIRGTDHEPMVIPNIPGMAALGAPGLYDKVNEGETFIRNKGGMLSLKRGEIGFSPLSPNSAPQMLVKIPDFYKVDIKTDARDSKEGAEAKPDDNRRTAPATGGLLRPSLAARREALMPPDGKIDPNAPPPPPANRTLAPTTTLISPLRTDALAPATTLVAPTNVLSPPTNTLIAPTTTLIAPSAINIAPTTTLIAPTVIAPMTPLVAPTSIAPTTPLIAPTVIAPMTPLIAPTTTLIAPATTTIAPTTTLVAPTTTLIAPTTPIAPKMTLPR